MGTSVPFSPWGRSVQLNSMGNPMKKLLIATALAATLTAPALAQTTPTAPGVQTTPTTPSATSMFYSQQAEWRASKLMGAKVTNAAGETIGDINDLLIDKENRVATVVSGIGGFLGIGERHAAFTFSTLQLTRDASGDPLVRLNTTKDQLKAMPEWQWNPASAEWRTEKLMGAKVRNTAGDTIGDINELLLDKDGKVAAAVIGVGGFLGVGERHAAVPFTSLQMTRDAKTDPVIKVNVTREQLRAAPEWKWQPVRAN